MSPEIIPLALEPTALPNLTTFVGVHQQLAVLPQPALNRIEILDLTCEPLFATRLEGVGGVCATLKMLTSLTSLDLWLHIPDFNDYSTFFKELTSSCPKLTDLHFMCTTFFGVKPLNCLIEHLSFLPHLRCFSLTKGHKYIGDDTSMLRTALRIIRARPHPRSKLSSNPELRQVNIRWAREKCPNHLKQEGTYDIERIDSDISSVAVYEKGINVLGKVFTRRYRYEEFPAPSRASSPTGARASASSSHIPSTTAASNDTTDKRRPGCARRGRLVRKALKMLKPKRDRP